MRLIATILEQIYGDKINKSNYVVDKDGNIKLDTMGFPVKKIDKWLTRDIKKVVKIDKEK